ncbi:MAG: DUF1259 domain-containing protein [Gemmatimonadales bacterium]
MRNSITASAALAAAAIIIAASLSAQTPAPATPAAPAAPPAAPSVASTEWRAVDSVIGRAGSVQPGAVMRYSFPRSDLDVMANGVKVLPAFALGSWVAFKHVGGQAMVMGDLVLTEDEVGPVMAKLQAGGVEPTALHNHVLGESPRVMYMHIAAYRDEMTIAHAIHDALALTKTPPAQAIPVIPATIDLDTPALAVALGYTGRINGGVFQVSVPRAQRIFDGGMEVPPSMGVATVINFEPTGGGNAAITGDFVMTADEVSAVIRALQSHHIQPTALHSHMLTESPRLFFMHFWANGNAVTLAQGVRAALAEMRVQAPGR